MHGRTILTAGLFAGAVTWALAMQFAAFAQSGQPRVVLTSVIIATYAFLTAYELRRERRRAFAARCLALVVPFMHSAVFLSPIALSLLLPVGAPSDALFVLFALETLLYVVGTAFIVVVMAKERAALAHKTASMTDPLTGLFNRRAFLETADRLILQRGRKSQPVSVLLFDLDRFKSINDRFGHAVGDDVLRRFARTVTASMRSTDVIARLGGEEFAAILPSGATEAALVAERVRGAFETAGVEVTGHHMDATVSVGIAAAVAPTNIEAVLARADAALYRAKANGRNRVEEAAAVDLASPTRQAPRAPASEAAVSHAAIATQ